MLWKQLEQAHGHHGAARRCEDRGTITRHKVKQLAGALNGFLGDRPHTLEEVGFPPLPIAIRANSGEPAVVLVPVSLEEEAQVKQRRRQEAPMLKEERDEKTANAAATFSAAIAVSSYLPVLRCIEGPPSL